MKSSSHRAIYAALIGNILVAMTKLIATVVTRSSAMLSESVHSFVDTGNQVLLLYGFRRAEQPADACHPFGHGKELYFWSFVVAILLFAMGAGVSIYEGIHSFFNPVPMRHVTINIVVIFLSFIFEGASWRVGLHEFKKHRREKGFLEAIRHGKDPSIILVLFEDSAAMTGLVIAGVGIGMTHLTGQHIWDSMASILIGVVLGLTAIWIAFETHGLLIGESADPAVVSGIKNIMAEMTEIEKVNTVLTMHLGPEEILLNVSADFHDDLPGGEIEKAVSNLTKHIQERYPHIRRVFVEARSGVSASENSNPEDREK